MQINNNVAIQGRFSALQKKENKRKNVEEKNNPAQSATERNLERIENLEEQIKKIQENEKLDEKTKKDKIKELTKEIEAIKLAEEERKLNELKKGEDTNKDGKVDEKDKVKENSGVNKDDKDNKIGKDDKSSKAAEGENDGENFDGDTLILSEDMKELLKNADDLKKTEAKSDARDKLKREERVLEREIEVDRGRAANPKRKEDKLLELRDRIDDLEDGKVEKATSVDKKQKIRISDNAEEKSQEELDAKFEQEKYDVENQYKIPVDEK